VAIRQALVGILVLASFAGTAVASDVERAKDIKSRRIQADVPPWPDDWDPEQVTCTRQKWGLPPREAWIMYYCSGEGMDVVRKLVLCGTGYLIPPVKSVLGLSQAERAKLAAEAKAANEQRMKICVQAIGTPVETASLVIPAVKCGVKGTVTHAMYEAGYSDDDVDAAHSAIDGAADVASLIKAVSEAVGKAVEKSLGGATKELAPDAVGVGDTWDSFGKAWRGFRSNQLTSLRFAVKEVDALVNQCRFKEAEERILAIEKEKDEYVLRARSQLHYYEQVVFCEARAGSGSSRERVESSRSFASMRERRGRAALTNRM
jgi:hypothetical protein